MVRRYSHEVLLTGKVSFLIVVTGCYEISFGSVVFGFDRPA